MTNNVDIRFETDVLVVGSGPAGGAAALLLATYGVDCTMITRFNWLSTTPRAHITNQRTMEVLRDLGLESEGKDVGTPQHLMGNNVFCESLVGAELGRLHSWGTHPRRRADYELASPCAMTDLPQTYMEPILVTNAAKRGAKFRTNTEYVSLKQDRDGVTVTVRDRLTDETYAIRAKYLIGADGGRSKVAEDIGLPFEGQMGLGGSMNILFDADLSHLVAHRPSVLYWVLQPGADIGGVGMGVVRMVRPWNEWLAIWGYDMDEGAPELTDERATEIVHNLIGDDTIPVTIRSTSTWTVNDMWATSNTVGRVFCMGDAVHRHPPTNGLGSNTSVQDAYNLAWKLAYVLRGDADPSLLETYDAERSPVAKQIVRRANQSVADYVPIFQALGILETNDPERMRTNIEARKDATPEAAEKREALRTAIAAKTYEFNANGVELNQRYESDAVVVDGTDDPGYARDAELYYDPTTYPGARLPHAWLMRNGREVSSLDLVGKGRFTLLTGIGGEGWIDAAKEAARTSGIELDTVIIGPGRDVEDPFGVWPELSGIAEDGVLLVRPDGHIAFRAAKAASSASRLLSDALLSILGRKQSISLEEAA